MMAVSLMLHPWNHAPRELPADAFEALRGWWLQSLRAQHAHITDPLSGRRLDTLEQCVAIDVSGGDGDGPRRHDERRDDRRHDDRRHDRRDDRGRRTSPCSRS